MKTLNKLLPAVLLFILLLLESALASAPPIQWQKTFGGNNYEFGYSVQQTDDSGYIIAGATYSYGVSSGDVYLVKTEPNGNSEWEKTFGGSSYDTGYSVQQTADGGYIIVGSTESYGAGFSDVYLIKTEPNGNSRWQKTFGGSSDERCHSFQQISSGGYIIAGGTWSYGAGSYDVYLIKTDPNGDKKWQKSFGGTDWDFGLSVQQTTDDGYIIAGYTFSYGAGDSDVYLIKTDPNGIKKWQKTFGGSESDRGSSVQQTTDGGYIIAGYTRSYGAGDYDVYLIKTDPNGDMDWQKTFGGSNWDVGLSVQQTSDGGYIIAGCMTSPLAERENVYFIKTDPNGNSRWQKTFGESNYIDRAYSARQTSDRGYVIAGFTYSYGAGKNDVYLVKLCPDGTLSADFNCDGTVYYEDLEILLAQWLQPPDILSADIFPELGDGIVNGFDFAALANDWLQSTIP
ncbi:MAG: hypothetical protein ACYSWZ_03080 [Planctomycetota bacterium]